MYFDGTSIPIFSGGIAVSMIESINDIQDNYASHKLPSLIITAGKDKLVDNKGARTFHS